MCVDVSRSIGHERCDERWSNARHGKGFRFAGCNKGRRCDSRMVLNGWGIIGRRAVLEVQPRIGVVEVTVRAHVVGSGWKGDIREMRGEKRHRVDHRRELHAFPALICQYQRV